MSGKVLRRSGLEFLRNLTPQILFVTIAVVSAAKLDLNEWDFTLAGILRTAPFAICLAIFFIAAITNIYNFIEEAVDALELTPKSKKSGIVEFGEEKVESRPVVISKSSKVVKFLIFMGVMVLVEAGLIAPLIMGIRGAVSILSSAS